jgi:preprotein translocase subunit SecG
MQFVVVFLQFVISIGLITLILLHSGRDAGMGGLGFTPTSQGGTHIVEKNLTRLTVAFTVAFFINTILLYNYLK